MNLIPLEHTYPKNVTGKTTGSFQPSLPMPTDPQIASSYKFDEPFWVSVKRGTPTECWEWQRKGDANGYGHVSWCGVGEYTHRVAYRLAVGPIPDGMCVLHSCDNPICCNPTHLRLGSPTENMRDRDARGRGRHGPNAPHRKFSVDEILAIRAKEREERKNHRGEAFRETMQRRADKFKATAEPLLSAGMSLTHVARVTGVTVKTAAKLCKLSGLQYDRKWRIPLPPDEFVAFVRQRRRLGFRIVDMARELGISRYCMRGHMRKLGVEEDT